MLPTKTYGIVVSIPDLLDHIGNLCCFIIIELQCNYWDGKLPNVTDPMMKLVFTSTPSVNNGLISGAPSYRKPVDSVAILPQSCRPSHCNSICRAHNHLICWGYFFIVAFSFGSSRPCLLVERAHIFVSFLSLLF